MKLHHTTKCSSAPIQNCIGEARTRECPQTRALLELNIVSNVRSSIKSA
jgi:hypothetical protein